MKAFGSTTGARGIARDDDPAAGAGATGATGAAPGEISTGVELNSTGDEL